MLRVVSESRAAFRKLYVSRWAKQRLGETTLAETDFASILKAAIKIEEQSLALYTMAQKRAQYPSSKKFLAELVQEELQHKKKLATILEDEAKLSELGERAAKIQDLKIVDYMKDAALTDDADYQQILVYAAKREKATYSYYNSLALGLGDTEAGQLFSKLAQEELAHKNKLEREYDDYVLWED
jgi:rubrerythrin